MILGEDFIADNNILIPNKEYVLPLGIKESKAGTSLHLHPKSITIYHNIPQVIRMTNIKRTVEKAKSKLDHAAQTAESKKIIEEREKQQKKAYEQFQRERSQNNGGQGSSGGATR